MAPTPRFQRSRQQPTASADTRRWIVVLIVLVGSLAVYGAERWMQSPDVPIFGNANVADGDTLTISGLRIRLVDIDAPEVEQTCTDAQGHDWPCGRQSANRLRALVRGQNLTCSPRSRDQYGRTLAVCSLPDKTNVNSWMVQQGLAVTYDYAQVYSVQQADAKSAKRGMWAGTFTVPREWRRQHPPTGNDRKD